MVSSDVATQSSLSGWTLGKWAGYYSTEPSLREKTRNVISLEISGTKLGEQVLPPRLVRDIDWVEKFWPDNRKGNSHPYPKVQLYCLMGVGGAWTVSLPASIDVSPYGFVEGLAHRFRWFIRLLPYSQGIEGLSPLVPSSNSLIFSPRPSSSYAPRLLILPHTNAGPEARYKAIHGLETWLMRSPRLI